VAGVVAFTSFTCAELAPALTLARDLKQRHPDWRRVGVLVDRAPDGLDESWRRAFDRVLEGEALYREDWRRFVFKHDAAEAAAAVKGRALRALLDEGADKVLYFAPEIAIFGDLGEIEARLDAASILLTPHQGEPNQGVQAIADNEALAMRYGVFNLSFLGVRNDPAGLALARWWAARLDRASYDDGAGGAYNDQRHFDLAPALFDGVEVLREPGCHVASWNLSRREIEIARDGRILVNGCFPLKFFNFANPYGDAAILTERYAGRRLAVYELAAYRKRALAAAAAPDLAREAWAWAYARFDDGAPVASMARRLYRGDPELGERYRDPFAAGPDTYLAYLQANRPDLL
jgi:hypothetical protein